LGDFTYSPDSGFSGRAQLIRISREKSSTLLTNDSSLTRTESSHRHQLSQITARSNEKKQTERVFKLSPVSLYWYLAGFIILLLLAGMIARKLL